jgi:hypothetical protein
MELHGKATVVLDLQLIKSSFLTEIFTTPSFADIRGLIASTPVINGSFDDIILVHGNPLLI